jgi:hypothetical protein
MSTLVIVGLLFGLVAFYMIELVLAVITEASNPSNSFRTKSLPLSLDSSYATTSVPEYTGYDATHGPVIRVRVLSGESNRIDLEEMA